MCVHVSKYLYVYLCMRVCVCVKDQKENYLLILFNSLELA